MTDPDRQLPVFDALAIPPEALDQGGVEVLRAAIVEGGLHVSLRRAFDEPDAFGMMLADIARHVARLYAAETAMTEDQVLDRVCSIFEAEMQNPTDPGTTSAVS